MAKTVLGWFWAGAKMVEWIPNYTGPYRSDGSWQTSVEFGSSEPKDELDALSRLHDSAYAKWDDRLHRTVADEIYNKEAKKLVGKFPELASFAVLYVNHTARSFENLIGSVAKPGLAGLGGLIVGGVKNVWDLNQYLIYGDKTRKEILDYYKTDPHIELQGGSKVIVEEKSSFQPDFGIFNNFDSISGRRAVVEVPLMSEKKETAYEQAVRFKADLAAERARNVARKADRESSYDRKSIEEDIKKYEPDVTKESKGVSSKYTPDSYNSLKPWDKNYLVSTNSGLPTFYYPNRQGEKIIHVQKRRKRREKDAHWPRI